MTEELKFEYALQRPDGLFYNGNAYGTNLDFGPKHKAYTYTEKGAHLKKRRFAYFHNCKIVKIF